MKCEKVVFLDDDLENTFNQMSEDEPVKRALKKAIRDIEDNAWVGRNEKENYSDFEKK